MYHNSKTNLPVPESDGMKRCIQPDYRKILIIIVWILLKRESLLDCTHSLL